MPIMLAVVLVGLAPAAPVPKELKKKNDAAMIVGTWKATTSDSACFEFAADGALQTWHGQTKTSEMNWTYALVPGGVPRRIRLTRVPDKENGYDCLYELDGDTLRFVFLLRAGMEPPNKLEAGPDLQLHVLARDTASK